jgi:hypothetical protein
MRILILFIIIIIIYYIFRNHFLIESINVDGPYPLKINFLKKKNACDIFKNFHNEYFSKMSFKESKIRGCIKKEDELSSNVQKCKIHYCENIQNFTELEEKQLFYVINIINKLYKKKFNKLLTLPWNLIKVTNNIEGGMPHTITNNIVLPQRFLNYLNTFIKNNQIYNIINTICLTLIHEQFHVFQKMYPNVFKELYINYWNFTPCKINLNKKYIDNQRINPDGYDDWCFKYPNYMIYPFVELKKKPDHLDSIEKIAFKFKNNKIDYNNIKKLSHYTEYDTFFCNISQNYHPHEISAVLLSQYIIDYFFNKENLNKCTSVNIIQPWIKKYLI